MRRLGILLWCWAVMAQAAAAQDIRQVYLQDGDGVQTRIASLEVNADQTYSVTMNAEVFSNHFLSMRPFKCLNGPAKTWCHVPYPYEIRRDVSEDMTDLEYDFLFVWKGRTDYGIDMWNGVYYRIEETAQGLRGVLHEMDMDLLSAPPGVGVLRPLRAQDIVESAPESHWLPVLVIK